jgi:hypothetical protein
MLWGWTILGMVAFARATFGYATLLRQVEWTAWATAETFLLVAVFAPSSVAAFLPNWGTTIASIGQAKADVTPRDIRDGYQETP